MPSTTANYSLAIYNSTTDASETFLNYRLAIAGTGAGSNMNLIDAAMADLQDQVDDLAGRKGIVSVPATFISANYYEATVADITTYETDQIIALKLDTSSDGTVTLDINSLGTKSVMKVNSAGSYVNIQGTDLRANREYNFKYDGTRWVWMDATASDQINANGTAGNFLKINANKEIEDGGYAPIDEDNMASNSDVKLPTQQSVKAYVDTNAAVLSAIRTYTSDDTWSKPAGLHHVIVEVVGGGGGGGGVTGVSSQSSCGNGGGGGAYKMKLILAAALGATETVTVGEGGAGGVAGANNGATGETSSFGTHVVSAAGTGGNGQAATATLPGPGAGAGGTGGDLTGALGDVNIPGGNSIAGSTWSITFVSPSAGGASFLSGNARSSAGTTADEDGVSGLQYGGGGSGARSSNDATDRAGGDGADGVVIVYEYV